MRIEVRNAFRKNFKIFLYLSIVSLFAYSIYILLDDYVFIEKYGLSWTGVGIWALYYLAYYTPFLVFYWIATTIAILIYFQKE
ncbi:MAG TPA: hypothetical protein VGK39_05010 [Cyclobacteriaceae bacterium]